MDTKSRYASDLNAVLDNGAALDAFREWIELDETRTSEGLSLHFALKGLKKYIADGEPTVNKIACQLHRKFISLRSGSCSFLPESVRQEMSVRIHSLSSGNPVTYELFQSIVEPVRKHLASYHAQFACSELFYNFVNRSQNPEVSNPVSKFSTTPSNLQYPPPNVNLFTMGPAVNIDHPPPVPRHNDSRNTTLNWCDPSTSRAFHADDTFATLAHMNGYRTQRQYKLPDTASRFDMCSFRRSGHSEADERTIQGKFFGKFRSDDDGHPHGTASHGAHLIQSQHRYPEGSPGDYINAPFSDVSTMRHDRHEERAHFAAMVAEKLAKVVRDMERQRTFSGEECYARDLPKDCPSPLLPPVETLPPEETTSDEEIARYVGKTIDAEKRRRSGSASPELFHASRLSSDVLSCDPYGANGFAPPPSKHLNRYDFNRVHIPNHLTNSTPRTNRTIDYLMSDSSGFCSAESAFCDRSFDRRRPGPLECSAHPTGSLMRGQRQHEGQRHYTPNSNPFSTIQRPSRLSASQYITVTLREEGLPPLVAKIPSKEMTLRQFRRTFAISSRENKRFLFKSACEDDSAPFQWSVINDDSAAVPVFEGKITAECRSYCDDSD